MTAERHPVGARHLRSTIPRDAAAFRAERQRCVRAESSPTYTVTMVPEDPEDVGDLGGYAIHAADGEIGRVDRHDIETGVNYLLVTTGPWIFGRTVLLPASLIERTDHANQAVYMKCTKATIENAPQYREDRAHRADLDAYYGKML